MNKGTQLLLLCLLLVVPSPCGAAAENNSTSAPSRGKRFFNGLTRIFNPNSCFHITPGKYRLYSPTRGRMTVMNNNTLNYTQYSVFSKYGRSGRTAFWTKEPVEANFNVSRVVKSDPKSLVVKDIGTGLYLGVTDCPKCRPQLNMLQEKSVLTIRWCFRLKYHRMAAYVKSANGRYRVLYFKKESRFEKYKLN